jgi:hypothetical protein
VPNLKTYGFNDKISSIKVIGNYSTFIGFENDTYSGRSLVVRNPTNLVQYPSDTGSIPNLKKVACGSGNWNDRISSFTS